MKSAHAKLTGSAHDENNKLPNDSTKDVLIWEVNNIELQFFS